MVCPLLSLWSELTLAIRWFGRGWRWLGRDLLPALGAFLDLRIIAR